MASASSSTAQIAIPVHSHPLLADDLPSRGRRTRPTSRQDQADHPSADGSNNTWTPSYFPHKERLDAEAQAGSSNGRANWDGSVRGYGKADRARTTRDASSSRRPLPTAWDRPPTFVAGSSKDRLSAGSMARTAELVAVDGLPTGAASRILSHPWHDYSDEAVQSAISAISVAESPAFVSSHPYHTSLRVLSSAVHNLTKIRREMEESLRVIQEKERARRQRAEELMKELQASDRDIARRVMQSLFTDDDEGMHKVERSQSNMVSARQFDMYRVANVSYSPSPTPCPRRWSMVSSFLVSKTKMISTAQRQSLPKSSSPRHQSRSRLLVVVHPKVPLPSRIMIYLTQAASILLEDSARARQASKVPNPIALRWAIGWGLCGESLEISTNALPSRMVWMSRPNQTQFFRESRPTTFLHHHQHLSNLGGAKFHAVSLAHWGSPS